MDFNIESTDDIVDYINDILYKKCGKTLRIEFDLFDEMTTGKPLEYFDIFDPDAETPLMLCLFLGKKCISSITCKINFVDAGPKGLLLGFKNNFFKETEKLITLVNNSSGQLKIRPDQKLFFQKSLKTNEDKIETALSLINQLETL